MQAILVVSSILLWVMVLLNLILTLALVRRGASKTLPPIQPLMDLKPGMRAPDFTAETLSGETVSLAKYAGREVAFLFIGPHCGPCRESLPHYEALGPFAHQAGVELVLVSIEDAASTRAFVNEHKMTLPVLVAPRESNPFITDYKVSGTPAYCLVNANGIVESAGSANSASSPGLEEGEWWKLTDEWKQSQPRVVGQARAWT